MSRWTWQIDSGWAWPAAVLALALAWLAWRQWRLSIHPRATLAMECLRLAIVALLLVTLARPERVTTLVEKLRPQVAVLVDDSGSMTTRDVVDAEGTVVSRREWVEQAVAGRFWSPLEPRYEVTVERLSGGQGELAGTDLNGALARVGEAYPRLRGVVLLSDGAWNEGGSPVAAATRLAIRQAAVYSVAVGARDYLPDVELDQVKVPAFCLLDEHVSVPFLAVNRLPREVETELQVRQDGQVVASRPLRLPPHGQIHDSVLWHAAALGEAVLTFELPAQPEEKLTDNNRAVHRLAVREERLRVLVVESLPRWEYRYLRNALSRDPGIDVDCLLLHPGLERGDGPDYIQSLPDTRESMGKYDVIFLGDVGAGGGELTDDSLELIRGVVEQLGSGLVLLPGARGRHLSLLDGPLGELYPVSLDRDRPEGIGGDQEATLQLTGLGADHLLTMLANTPSANRRLWRDLPGFYWSAAVDKAKPGAEVLAVHSRLRSRWGHVPLLAIRQAGMGNVLFMGSDSAWRWRKGVEDVYHYRFWGQVVRWMAHPRHLAQREGIRLVFSPEAPRQGDQVALHATVADSGGFPLTGAEVIATVSGAAGHRERLVLEEVEGGWGVYRGRVPMLDAGDYRVEVEAAAAGRRLTATLRVSRRDREQIGHPANVGGLEEIARAGGGAWVEPLDLASLIGRIELLPEPSPRQVRYLLWCQWWWGLLIVLLLGLYWTLRKWYGFV